MLVVEDELPVCPVTCQFLGTGFQCVDADTAAHALEIIDGQPRQLPSEVKTWLDLISDSGRPNPHW